MPNSSYVTRDPSGGGRFVAGPEFHFRKVWLVEEATFDHDREVDRHQPIAVYADETRARDRAAKEVRECIVSQLWLEDFVDRG